MQMSTPELPLVVATEGMSDEHIIRHINSRHADCWKPFPAYRLEPVPHPDQLARGERFALVSRDGWEVLHARLHAEGNQSHVHS